MRRVAFDIGNVLCKVDLDKLYLYLKDKFNVPISTSSSFLEDINFELDTGSLTLKRALQRHFDFSESQTNDILEVWLTAVERVDSLNELVNCLLQKYEYNVALLSNIGFEHKAFLLNECEPFKNCIKHFSCDLGVRKPSKLFFQSFLIDNPHFKGALYFDDRPENVLAAAEAGLNAQHFMLEKQSSEKQAASYLEKIILSHFSNF